MAVPYTILAAVGTDPHSFDRFVQWVDSAVAELKTHCCLLQAGFSRAAAPHCERVPFLPWGELRARLRSCDYVVCHGGTGIISSALQSGKRPIVVPRLARLSEHINDHQLDIVRALAAKHLVHYAADWTDLLVHLRQPSEALIEVGAGPTNLRMLDCVSRFLRRAGVRSDLLKESDAPAALQSPACAIPPGLQPGLT